MKLGDGLFPGHGRVQEICAWSCWSICLIWSDFAPTRCSHVWAMSRWARAAGLAHVEVEAVHATWNHRPCRLLRLARLGSGREDRVISVRIPCCVLITNADGKRIATRILPRMKSLTRISSGPHRLIAAAQLPQWGWLKVWQRGGVAVIGGVAALSLLPNAG